MKKELIVEKKPKSPIAEIFRTLRTNIQFMNSDKGLKTILVTSTVAGEGKSWISSNLGLTFAQAGKKVLLIDADMRKGRLATLFQVNKQMGLSNLLSEGKEDIDFWQYIQDTEVENLYIISSGNIPPNPSELLARESTAKILKKLEEMFDVIILDGTPSLIITDSMILSRIVDTTIIVASYKSTKKEELIKVKKAIENIGGKIAGVVFNKVEINAKEYNNSYYYRSRESGRRRITATDTFLS